MNIDRQHWRQSPSHPRLMVSSAGVVKDTLTGREHGGTDGGSAGYKQFRYKEDGAERRPYVHRLVCEAFHGPAPDGKPFALHHDDVRHDNSAANLRWGSNSENILEYLARQGAPERTKAPTLALIHGYMSAGMSKAAIARVCGCDPWTVTRALRRGASI